MPDEVEGTVDANSDAKTPQQTPAQPLPPAVEGHENSEGGRNENNGKKVKENKPPKRWVEYVEGLCAIALVVITAYYTYYAFRQSRSSETAANAAKSAADTAACALRQTQQQFSETLKQIEAQTAAQQRATSAATSAANTAKDTLHVSQRAYIYFGTPDIDFVGRKLTVPLINGGHIPSGAIDISVFEITYRQEFQKNGMQSSGDLIERHWRQGYIRTITPNLPLNYVVDIPALDQTLFDAERQGFAAVGVVSYSDGFSGTPKQVSEFCFISIRNNKTNSDPLIVCDPIVQLPKLKAFVGYPSNEDKNNK